MHDAADVLVVVAAAAVKFKVTYFLLLIRYIILDVSLTTSPSVGW